MEKDTKGLSYIVMDKIKIMNSEIKDIYYYIKHVEALQEIRKSSPNNYDLGNKVREYLLDMEGGTTSNKWKDGRSESDPVTKWNNHKKDS